MDTKTVKYKIILEDLIKLFSIICKKISPNIIYHWKEKILENALGLQA